MRERHNDPPKSGLVSRLSKFFSTKPSEDTVLRVAPKKLNGYRKAYLQNFGQTELQHQSPTFLDKSQGTSQISSFEDQQDAAQLELGMKECMPDMEFSPLGCSIGAVSEQMTTDLVTPELPQDTFPPATLPPNEQSEVVKQSEVVEQSEAVEQLPSIVAVDFASENSLDPPNDDVPAQQAMEETDASIVETALPESDPEQNQVDLQTDGEERSKLADTEGEVTEMPIMEHRLEPDFFSESQDGADSEGDEPPAILSQQSFNFTFLDTLASECSPCKSPPRDQAPPDPQPAQEPLVNRLPEKQEIDYADATSSSSSEDYASDQLRRETSVHPDIPLLDLCRKAPPSVSSSQGQEIEMEEEPACEQPSASEASAARNSLASSSMQSVAPDARVEINLSSSMLEAGKGNNAVPLEGQGKKALPVSSPDLRRGKRLLQSRSKRESPQLRISKGRQADNEPGMPLVGARRLERSHKARMRFSPPFILGKLKCSKAAAQRVTEQVSSPKRAVPLPEAEIEGSEAKDNESMGRPQADPALISTGEAPTDQSIDQLDRDKVEPYLEQQEVDLSEKAEGLEGSPETSTTADPTDKLRIDIPAFPSPSNASKSSQDRCKQPEFIHPRTNPPPEPAYKIPALKLPTSDPQTWQEGLKQSWHPRQVRRELLQREKEKALLLAGRVDAGTMPQPANIAPSPPVLSPSKSTSAPHLERAANSPHKHTWSALTPESVPRLPPHFASQQSPDPCSSLHHSALPKPLSPVPRPLRRVRFAEEHPSENASQLIRPGLRQLHTVALPSSKAAPADRSGLWSGAHELGIDSQWTANADLVPYQIGPSGAAVNDLQSGQHSDSDQKKSQLNHAAALDFERRMSSQDADVSVEMGAAWGNSISMQMDLAKIFRTEQAQPATNHGDELQGTAFGDQYGHPSRSQAHVQRFDISFAGPRPSIEPTSLIEDRQPLDSQIIRHRLSTRPPDLPRGRLAGRDLEPPEKESSVAIPRPKPNRGAPDIQIAKQAHPDASLSDSQHKHKRKLPTLTQPKTSIFQKQAAAPVWTTHTSTKALLQQLSNKQATKSVLQPAPRVKTGLVAARQAEIVAKLGLRHPLTTSKTGPLWTAPPSLRDWEQSTALSSRAGDPESQSASPNSPTSIHGHPTSFCTSPRSNKSLSWVPEMQAVQEEPEEEDAATENMSVISFRPILPSQMLQPPARLTQAALQNRAVLDTVACDVDLSAFQSTWPTSTTQQQFAEAMHLECPDLPTTLYTNPRLAGQRAEYEGLQFYSTHPLGAV